MDRNQDVIAIYSRKSRFTGKGESVGNQVELCRAYIRTAYGPDYADGAAVFEDEGFSGGNLNRPGFQRMMQAARDRQFRAVVVYRLDRISRNISDFSALIEELGRLGIDFVSLRESFDTSSPMGRAMMYIASVFSQLERETIAERIRDNMQELAKTGRWLGGTTPLGYTSEAVTTVTVDGRRKRACRLKPIPGEAAIVRKIYGLYRETDSLTATEAALLRQRVKTRSGHDFTRFSIRGILQNPVYLIADEDALRYFQEKQAEIFSPPEDFDGVRGILAYNRTDQQKGKATVYRPISQWIVSVGQHPGLIPARSWIRVQESLERNRCRSYRKPRTNEALLTGRLWCRCGSRMYPKLTGRITAEGKAGYTYLCKRRERSKKSLCSCPGVAGNRLDDAVLAETGRLAEDTGHFLALLEKGSRAFSGDRGPENEELTSLRQQQTENHRKIQALVDSLENLEDSTAAVYIKERLEALYGEQTGLEARIQAEEQRAAPPPLEAKTLAQTVARLASFREALAAMTVTERRAALSRLVDRVVWDGRCARLVFSGGKAGKKMRWGEDSK